MHRNRLLALLLALFILFTYFYPYPRETFAPFDDDHHAIIHRIRTISIGDENHTEERLFVPWMDRYNLSQFFDFYWYYTGGYQWHLQQMIDLIDVSQDRPIHSFDLSYTFDYFHEYPESGVIIDTAPDPFPSIFPRLLQTPSSLKKICQRLEIIDHWCPSHRYFKQRRRDLLTYGVYNVIIGNPAFHRVHYDEIIYLDDVPINQISFVTQILPRLIRLISLVPQTAVILSPYFNRKIPYIHQYVDLLTKHGLLSHGRRLVRLNPKKSYHAYVVYSTSTPRDDLVILHSIFLANYSSSNRKLILVIRNSLERKFSDDLIDIIHQFELPAHAQIRDYHSQAFYLPQIMNVFPQALVVIGLGNEILSSIIWCLPGTQIVEIGQKNMSSEFYEISLQLKFDYWLEGSTDLNDWRNLFLKIFTHLHNL